MGFDPGFECPTYLATLKSSDRTKQSVCGWQYIYIYIYIYKAVIKDWWEQLSINSHIFCQWIL